MNGFHEINPKQISENMFQLIGDDWYLLTSGDKNGYNTMTASWGTAGILWGKPVAVSYVRPQRYTYEFMEKNDCYTLSFFDDAYRPALNFCGSKSGRDYDKAKETGLTPCFVDGTVCFQEAKLVLVCKKMYSQDLDPSRFLVPEIEKNYANRDYHRMYIGEILKVYSK